VGYGIAVDATGSAYVTGNAASANFPTQNPLQVAVSLGVFVSKLNAAGSALSYSTFLGASGTGRAIAVDGTSTAYVTGETASATFPTKNPAPAAYAGGNDAFVSRLNAAGTAFVYSTFLGGSGFDSGRGIAVDANGAAYVAGYTGSTNFPTQSPFQP